MIETARLLLRPFEERDRAALRAMWADPVVARDIGGLGDAAMSDANIARHEGYRGDRGLGFWVTERRADGALVGYSGLKPGALATPAEGEVEIGWALVRAHWGQGYAVEAACAARDYAFVSLGVPRITAITARRNAASIRVMERIGLRHTSDFHHPSHAPDDPAGDSVFYAIDRSFWREQERGIEPYSGCANSISLTQCAKQHQ